jgi:hypothetical protein
MTNTTRARFVATALFAALAGCGPSWSVIKQATPNTLASKKSFSVDAVSWDGLSIGGQSSEADWIAKRKPEEQGQFKADWEKDKGEGAQLFATRVGASLGKWGGAVAPSPGGDAFGIKPHINMYEPGFWSPMGFGNSNTVVVMTVDFVDGAGAVQDTVKFTGSVQGTVFTPVPSQRMRQCIEMIADQVAEYLQGRSGGK